MQKYLASKAKTLDGYPCLVYSVCVEYFYLISERRTIMTQINNGKMNRRLSFERRQIVLANQIAGAGRVL